KLTPKETTLRIDGAPGVLESDGSLLLSFGRHLLLAEAPGHAPENREVNVIGGERQELPFQLRPVVAASSVPKLPGPEASDAAVVGGAVGGEATSSSSSRAMWWYAGAGVAAAGAVGALIAWRAAAKQVDSCDQPPPDMECDNSGGL